jgi:hypothetical protein
MKIINDWISDIPILVGRNGYLWYIVERRMVNTGILSELAIDRRGAIVYKEGIFVMNSFCDPKIIRVDPWVCGFKYKNTADLPMDIKFIHDWKPYVMPPDGNLNVNEEGVRKNIEGRISQIICNADLMYVLSDGVITAIFRDNTTIKLNEKYDHIGVCKIGAWGIKCFSRYIEMDLIDLTNRSEPTINDSFKVLIPNAIKFSSEYVVFLYTDKLIILWDPSKPPVIFEGQYRFAADHIPKNTTPSPIYLRMILCMKEKGIPKQLILYLLGFI